MSFENSKANVLDLTEKQTLFELAFDESELLGPSGAKLIADIKERARDAEYTHLYYRDPIRPGIIWFVVLDENEMQQPTRGKWEECRMITEKVFPDFIENLSHLDEDQILAAIPPIQTGISAVELAVALEYLVFIYPKMVRAWAALIFSYRELMNLKQSAKSVYAECVGTCENSQIVSFMMGESGEQLVS